MQKYGCVQCENDGKIMGIRWIPYSWKPWYLPSNCLGFPVNSPIIQVFIGTWRNSQLLCFLSWSLWQPTTISRNPCCSFFFIFPWFTSNFGNEIGQLLGVGKLSFEYQLIVGETCSSYGKCIATNAGTQPLRMSVWVHVCGEAAEKRQGVGQ